MGALAAIVVAALTLGFDITILNVALPTIASALQVGTSELQWIVNAYVLVLAGLMLTCGVLGDRWGRKRLILIGLVLFGAASVAATWADSAGVLIAARAVMGLGGAIIMPVAFAVLPALFPSHERGKAVAVTVAATALGIPLGPLIGGWLLEHFWWGSIFLINIPMAGLALAAIAVLMPENKDPHPPRPDLLGAVLSTAGLVALVYGLIEAPDRGWSNPVVVAALAAAAVLLAAFGWWQLRIDHPMIDLRLFKRRQFLWGSVAGVLVTFGMLGMLFVIPQYLQLVEGFDPFDTGLRLLPMIGGLVVGASAGERIAARTGHRIPITVGLLLLAAGMAVGAGTDVHSAYAFVAAWLVAVGMGIGMALSPAMDAVLAALPPERSGSGTAITMTLRQVGGALGIALLGSVLSQGYTTRLDTTGLPAEAVDAAQDSLAGALAVAVRAGNPGLAADAQDAFVHGMTLVLLVCAGVALLSAIAVAVLMPRRAQPATAAPAQRQQEPV